MTKRILLVIAGMLLSGAVLAAGSAPTIDLGELKMDSSDQASLQRGARTFMNYCSGCHSLEYMRYERMATDIGITLDDGPSKLQLASLDATGKNWQVTMHEGRNRQIRRTFDALGYNVQGLHRTTFGSYQLGQLAQADCQVIEA